MAGRTVKWTVRANQDKLEIYTYWTNRNHSTEYPRKLERLFNEAMKLTAIFPEAGQRTNIKNIRFRQVDNFKLFYKIQENSIVVLTVWDDRQDPKQLIF